MKAEKNPGRKALCLIWAVLYGLTALLGLWIPRPDGLTQGLMTALSLLFFLPPWRMLVLARREGDARTVGVLRWLSLLALVLTTGLLCIVILTANAAEPVQLTVHVLTGLLTAPMLCSGFYALPLFCWAALLMAALRKKK